MYYKYTSACTLDSLAITNLKGGKHVLKSASCCHPCCQPCWWFKIFEEAAYWGKSQGFGIRPPCSCAVVQFSSPTLRGWCYWALQICATGALFMVWWRLLDAQKTLAPFPSSSHMASKTTHSMSLKFVVEPHAGGMAGKAMGSLCVFEILLQDSVCSGFSLVHSWNLEPVLPCGLTVWWSWMSHLTVTLEIVSMSTCGFGLLRCLVQMRAEVPATWQALDRALGMKIGRNVCIVRRQCLAKGPNASALISLTPPSLCGESHREW